MTTIVALHKPGLGTIIGSDRMVSTGSHKALLSSGGKWILSNDGQWAVGISGAYRTFGLVENHRDDLFVDLPARDPAHEFCQRMIGLLQAFNYEPSSSEGFGGARSYGQNLLLAGTRAVWSIDSSMAPLKIKSGQIGAGGSGTFYALGAAHATRATVDPIDRVKASVEAGINLDPDSGGQVWLTVLKSK